MFTNRHVDIHTTPHHFVNTWPILDANPSLYRNVNSNINNDDDRVNLLLRRRRSEGGGDINKLNVDDDEQDYTHHNQHFCTVVHTNNS